MCITTTIAHSRAALKSVRKLAFCGKRNWRNKCKQCVKKFLCRTNGGINYLARLESEQVESRQSSGLFVQNLKNDISAISARLERLTDAYLAEALELGEYLERKNALMSEKKTLEERLVDFERKGNHWLELMRNWILEANQAGNLINKKIFRDERFSGGHRLEPPHSGGNSGGGIRKAVAFPCGNATPCAAPPRAGCILRQIKFGGGGGESNSRAEKDA